MTGSLATAVASNGNLKLGYSGSSVVLAQKLLAQLGYPLSGTGYFGGKTDAAVHDFQTRHNLKSDGVIGPITAAAIDAAVAGPIVIPPEVSDPMWVQYGKRYLKLKEGVGSADNPEILQWGKDEGGDIAREFTHDSIPWCSLFANMILTKCGLKGTETLWALDWDSDTKWPNSRLAGPAVGAFMPMKRTGGGHITVCVGRIEIAIKATA
jgi:uncharacterized protein (TIGR02594 family)